MGDGYVGITWTPVLGVSYLAFGSTNAALTTLNWTDPSIAGFPLNNVGNSSQPPALECNTNGQYGINVPNGLPFYFTVDAHTGTSPGGTGSPAVTAIARPAGGTWVNGTPLAASINDVGYAVITTCLSTGLPTGIYVAVGPGGDIFESTDGTTWIRRGPPGYVTDLYGVATVTGSVNVPQAPNLLFIAVGAGGAVVRSTDGISWDSSIAQNASVPTLRSISVAGSTFVAVGDAGRIQTSADGLTWVTAASNTAANFHAVHCFSTACVAVGDAGVVDTSGDGGMSWTVTTLGGGTSALRAIAFGNYDDNVTAPNVLGVNGTVLINTWVLVGDNATLFESNTVSGTTGTQFWTAVSINGAANFVAISYTTQFVAIDSNGNAFASQTAIPNSWSPPVATGITDPVSVTSNGHGYVLLGSSGDNTSSF